MCQNYLPESERLGVCESLCVEDLIDLQDSRSQSEALRKGLDHESSGFISRLIHP